MIATPIDVRNSRALACSAAGSVARRLISAGRARPTKYLAILDSGFGRPPRDDLARVGYRHSVAVGRASDSEEDSSLRARVAVRVLHSR
jgi:hypothetical protein